jgi:hypothetical protein
MKNKYIYFFIALGAGLLAVRFLMTGEVGTIRSSMRKEAGLIKYTVNDIEYLEKLKGGWICTEYFDRIKLSKSPLKATRGMETITFFIEKENGIYYWVFSGKGQPTERVILHLISKESNNVYEVKTNDELRKGDVWHISKDFHGIQWVVSKKETPLNFIPFKEKQHTELINEIVIAGKYRDKSGSEYIFNGKGNAIWPNSKFRYRIQYDEYGSGDILEGLDWMGGVKFVYGFKVKGNALSIYKIIGGDVSYEWEKSPWLVLSKI